jgi:hypothetical protein
VAAPGPASDDDLTGLPLDALRQLVYAQGADERDERWIRAAAELTRRERAAAPAPARAEGPEATAATDDSDDADAADEPVAADPPGRPGRRPLAWAGAALVVGLLAGAGITAGLDGSAEPSADPPASPSATPSAPAPPAPPDPTTVRSRLGTEISGRSRGIAIMGVFDRPQDQADRPPRSPYGDVDLTSIRGVQTSVGLYVARTISDDMCLLVYPWTGPGADGDPEAGTGIASCVSPAQLAASGLSVTWVAEVPVHAIDGTITMGTGELTATWTPDGMLSITVPGRPLAY